MKINRVDALIALFSAIIFSLFYATRIHVALQIVTWYLINLTLPSIIIEKIASNLEVDKHKCEGLKNAGRYIGYLERSLIFFTFTILYFAQEKNPLPVIGVMTLVMAGKGLFRFGGKEERACAEWYILGTLLSLTSSLIMSWIFFNLLIR